MASDKAMEAAFRYVTEAPRDEDLDLLDCDRLADFLDRFAAEAVREEREEAYLAGFDAGMEWHPGLGNPDPKGRYRAWVLDRAAEDLP